MEPTTARAVIDYLFHLKDSRPLQSRQESDAATALVHALGLPGHHDTQKDWDTFKCVSYVVSQGDLEAPVLDAGSGVRVVVPRWLHHLGYRNLYACDLKGSAVKPAYADLGIKVSKQDLTQTDYPDNFFQAVTCVSVIEHNVPLQAFATEIARVLRPGGLLVVSTDYWSEYIDCKGIFPYGEEAGDMKIIEPVELTSFIEMCAAAGLELCQPVSYETQEKAVRWERTDRDYTFIFLAFRKAA